MKYLVYCILSEEELPREEIPAGVGGVGVSLAREGGLAAAYSPVEAGGGGPDIFRVREYAAVIDAFHRAGTVLPMRYGCALDSEERIESLLRERRDELLALLEGVRDCVEMVLHVTLNAPDAAPPREEAPAPATGAGHLSALAKRYAWLDAVTRLADTAAEECRLVFGGLFRKWKSDYSPRAVRPGEATDFRIFFLVKREDREGFVDAYKRLALSGSAVMSGPWPPHNFVSVEAGGRREFAESIP